MSAPMSFAVVQRVQQGPVRPHQPPSPGTRAPRTATGATLRARAAARPTGVPALLDRAPTSVHAPRRRDCLRRSLPVIDKIDRRVNSNSYRIADFRAGPTVYSQTRLLALRSSLFGVARTKSRVARRLATDKFTTLAQPLQRNARRHLSRRCLTHRQRLAWPYDSGSTHALHPRPLRTPPCGAPMDDPHDGQYRRLRGMLAPPPSSDRDQ